jgi:hypothetical protein
MSEHDVTRKMLEIIRESEHSRKNIINESLKKRRLLKEVDENKEDKDLEPAELSEEEKKFRDTVTPRVKFNRFRLYPKAQNVEFSGKFTDSNIEWFYSLDDTRGVYITADLLQLNDQTLKQIQKLVAYYESWSNEWATKIAEEYNNDNKDEENAEEGPENLEATETEEGEEEAGAEL